jgi:hypothetical protein
MHKIVVFVLLNFDWALSDVIFCVLFVFVATQCECIVLPFLSCYVFHSFAQRQQQQLKLPPPLFICKNSNNSTNKKNYDVEGGTATYSYNLGKKKQEEKGGKKKEMGNPIARTASTRSQRTTLQHSSVSHLRMHTSH